MQGQHGVGPRRPAGHQAGWVLRGHLASAVFFLAAGLAGCDRVPADHTGQGPEQGTPTRSDFDTEGVADLGYLEPGASRELVYVLHAPADTPLTQIVVESDCPCVKGVGLPTRIEAGDFARVRVRFDAPEKTLRYQQDLAVVATGSGGRVEAWLTIDARLGLPLRASPDTVYGPGSGVTQIELRNDGLEPVKLIYALSDDPAVNVAVPQEPLAPGQSFTLAITIAESWSPSSPARLRIKTTSEAQPEVEVWVHPRTPGSPKR